MDKLDQLPPKDNTVITPEESEVINQFFGQSSESLPKTGGVDWKLIGYSTILFILLANPWIDQILCKIPYCNNAMYSFGMKLVIFAIVLVILSFYT
uniref:Uncharacterized protein n=1 Tax=Marseillevirus LCMAC102 TaxID=2506603 RepID=A0A481YUW3_9VIRU|nr:MAG: uncharacterized protein LCMAC102_03800 [Marseillevirus LCMAC102]